MEWRQLILGTELGFRANCKVPQGSDMPRAPWSSFCVTAATATATSSKCLNVIESPAVAPCLSLLLLQSAVCLAARWYMMWRRPLAQVDWDDPSQRPGLAQKKETNCMSSFLHYVTQFLAVVSVFVLQDLFFWTDLEPPYLFLTPTRTKLFFEFFIPHIKYVLEGKVANSPIATIVLPPPPSIGTLIAHGSVNCHQHCFLGNPYMLGFDLDIHT